MGKMKNSDIDRMNAAEGRAVRPKSDPAEVKRRATRTTRQLQQRASTDKLVSKTRPKSTGVRAGDTPRRAGDIASKSRPAGRVRPTTQTGENTVANRNSPAAQKIREESLSKRLKRNTSAARTASRKIGAQQAARKAAVRTAAKVVGRAVPGVGAAMMAADVVSAARKRAQAGAASRPKKALPKRAGREAYRGKK